MKRMTEEEAYVAMYAFLENWYQLTRADALTILLGSMSMMSDGRPMDAALWQDWMDAIDKMESGQVAIKMAIKN